MGQLLGKGMHSHKPVGIGAGLLIQVSLKGTKSRGAVQGHRLPKPVAQVLKIGIVLVRGAGGICNAIEFSQCARDTVFKRLIVRRLLEDLQRQHLCVGVRQL